MLNGKDHRHNIYLIEKTTCLIAKTMGVIFINREDHMFNRKNYRYNIYLIGKTACLMGKTMGVIFIQ